MIMTYKEVYEYLKAVQGALNNKPISNENAIQINDLAIKAVEKQIPKKPIQANYIVKVNGVDTLLDENEFIKCPSCTYKDIEVKHEQKYCHICGQALDWSNESEELL